MPPKAKEKRAKKNVYEGWAIFRCGYWLVCPSVITAMINRRNKKEEIIKVEIKEIKGKQ